MWQCTADPSLYNLLLFDYTRSIHIPDYFPKPSALRRLTPMQIQLGAVMSFADNASYLFVHHAAWPKAGNLICTILYHTLRAIYTSHGVNAATKFLQLQCDGGSENVNRTVFAVCVLFVAFGWATELTINRMVVGHTHSIIDQMFHKTRGTVRRSNIATTVDALTLIQKAHLDQDKRLIICWIDKVIDFDRLLDGCWVRHLHGHTKPLCYRITPGPDGIGSMPRIMYKHTSDGEWIGEGGTRRSVRVLSRLPSRDVQPELIYDDWQPSPENIKVFHIGQKYVDNPEEKEWLEGMKNGRDGLDLRIRPVFDDGLIGQDALMSIGDYNRIALRCISAVPSPFWELPPRGPSSSSSSSSSSLSSSSPSSFRTLPMRFVSNRAPHRQVSFHSASGYCNLDCSGCGIGREGRERSSARPR
jgi:hypothetical protein